MDHKSSCICTLLLLAVAALLLPSVGNAAWYVTVNGSDSNPGSIDRPWATLTKAANTISPGDTVFVRGGYYTFGQTVISRGGLPDAYVYFHAFPGERPILTTTAWQVFSIRSPYVEIKGFEVINMASAENDSCGNGISVREAHHVRILENIVHDCPGGGIESNRGDYIHIEGNITYGNAHWSHYQNSGISLYQNVAYDQKPGIHNIIRGNISHGNRNFKTLRPGAKVTDGNGIIIDDCRNTQLNSTMGSYQFGTLVENNLCYDNGGRGIHVYLSDNVVIVNNTCFRNNRSPDINDGEITAIRAGTVTIRNNIIMTDPLIPAYNNYGSTGMVIDHNLVFGTAGTTITGAGDIVGYDPLFINGSSDAANPNFMLRPWSPAIDSGSPDHAAEQDLTGISRPQGKGYDIGAYEARNR